MSRPREDERQDRHPTQDRPPVPDPETEAASAPEGGDQAGDRDAGAEEPGLQEQIQDESVQDEPTPEEILRRERDAFQEKWLRVVAELDNVRKRSRREVVDSRRLAQAEVLRALLEVRDNFERALQSLQENKDNEGKDMILEGVELIFQNFQGVLRDRGVQPIEAKDQPFDPAFHEAVGQLPREGVESGHVIEIIQQGFTFEDLVLRPARVIISS